VWWPQGWGPLFPFKSVFTLGQAPVNLARDGRPFPCLFDLSFLQTGLNLMDQLLVSSLPRILSLLRTTDTVDNKGGICFAFFLRHLFSCPPSVSWHGTTLKSNTADPTPFIFVPLFVLCRILPHPPNRAVLLRSPPSCFLIFPVSCWCAADRSGPKALPTSPSGIWGSRTVDPNLTSPLSPVDFHQPPNEPLHFPPPK